MQKSVLTEFSHVLIAGEAVEYSTCAVAWHCMYTDVILQIL